MNIEENFKICSKCKVIKDINEFPFSNKHLQQRKSCCKECKNAASRMTYENTRTDLESVARRIVKKCKEREKFRLSKFVQRRDNLATLPDIKLTEKDFDIDYLWVLNQRIIQDNKCYYTGREMVWSTGLIDSVKRVHPEAVTVERLDSNKPYVQNNCVLACWWSNCAKGVGSVEELVNFSFYIVKKYMQENNIMLKELETKNILFVK